MINLKLSCYKAVSITSMALGICRDYTCSWDNALCYGCAWKGDYICLSAELVGLEGQPTLLLPRPAQAGPVTFGCKAMSSQEGPHQHEQPNSKRSHCAPRFRKPASLLCLSSLTSPNLYSTPRHSSGTYHHVNMKQPKNLYAYILRCHQLNYYNVTCRFNTHPFFSLSPTSHRMRLQFLIQRIGLTFHYACVSTLHYWAWRFMVITYSELIFELKSRATHLPVLLPIFLFLFFFLLLLLQFWPLLSLLFLLLLIFLLLRPLFYLLSYLRAPSQTVPKLSPEELCNCSQQNSPWSNRPGNFLFSFYLGLLNLFIS